MAHVALMVPFDPVQAANPSNATQPPLRLAALAASTRALGHRVTAIDGVGLGLGNVWSLGARFRFEGLSIPDLVARVPDDADVLGVSLMFTQTWPAVRALLLAIRAAHPTLPLIVGGEGATGIGDHVVRESGVDAVVIGEGEVPWAEILRRLGEGEELDGIVNVVTSPEPQPQLAATPEPLGTNHLDDLPWPDWSDVPLEAYWEQRRGHGPTSWARSLPIIASRGCPFKCKFCTAPSTWGNQRYRSVQDVIGEMRHRQESLGIEFFSFNDLSITTRVAWFEEFVDALIAADLQTHWAVPAGIRAQKLSYDLLRRAKLAGMTHLQIAPETGSDKVLAWIDKRFERESVEETVVNAKRAGLPVCAYFIVGHPVEELEDYMATLRFLVRLAELGVDEVAVSAFTPLPGSPYFNELMEAGGVVIDDDFCAILAQGDLSLKVSVSPFFDGDEIRVMRLHALLWFYANRFTRRPGDLLALTSRLLSGEQETKLDRVFRYEFASLLRGFAPVLSTASLGVLSRVGRHLLRAPA